MGQQKDCPTEWNEACKQTPLAKKGCWSDKVDVITNMGRQCSISYYGDREDGCWQRPRYFVEGETVISWKPAVKVLMLNIDKVM